MYHVCSILQKTRLTLFEDESGDMRLNFSGSYDMQDFFAFSLKAACGGEPWESVVGIDFTGCVNLGDTGLMWFADFCPNLQEVRQAVQSNLC